MAAHFSSRTAASAVKSLLSFLPSNNAEMPPADDVEADLEPSEEDLALDTFIPDSMNQPYDMHTVIEAVVDEGDFLEVQALWAPNLLTGFGRVEGRPVGGGGGDDGVIAVAPALGVGADGLSQRGFAGSGRPHEAQNGGTHLVGGDFFDGDELQDAVFDFFQAIMILVEDRGRVGHSQFRISCRPPWALRWRWPWCVA